MTIPDGLKPLGIWDARDPLNGLPDMPRWLESTGWATEHIDRVDDAYRIEYYLLDAPFAKIWRFRLNDSGSKFALTLDGKPATEPPVTVMLDALPPAHLLAR